MRQCPFREPATGSRRGNGCCLFEDHSGAHDTREFGSGLDPFCVECGISLKDIVHTYFDRGQLCGKCNHAHRKINELPDYDAPIPSVIDLHDDPGNVPPTSPPV